MFPARHPDQIHRASVWTPFVPAAWSSPGQTEGLSDSSRWRHQTSLFRSRTDRPWWWCPSAPTSSARCCLPLAPEGAGRPAPASSASTSDSPPLQKHTPKMRSSCDGGFTLLSSLKQEQLFHRSGILVGNPLSFFLVPRIYLTHVWTSWCCLHRLLEQLISEARSCCVKKYLLSFILNQPPPIYPWF